MRPATSLVLAFVPALLFTSGQPLRPGPAFPGAQVVVSPEWLEAHLDDLDLVLLEIGDENEFKAGHIRRARRVDIMAFHHHGVGLPDPSHFVPPIEALGISNTSKVVLYGDNMDASLLWVVFEYVGLGNQTMVLDGGKRAWTAGGKPLTREEPAYLRRTFVPWPRPEIIVDATWISSRLGRPSLALLDARSSEEFSGAANDQDSRPGHIPGATNLDWDDTFDGSGRLLPAEVLREKFSASGYAPGDDLVVYCTVGMRASHLYLVARYLGYAPRLYLGSMQDWGSDPARQVVRSESQ